MKPSSGRSFSTAKKTPLHSDRDWHSSFGKFQDFLWGFHLLKCCWTCMSVRLCDWGTEWTSWADLQHVFSSQSPQWCLSPANNPHPKTCLRSEVTERPNHFIVRIIDTTGHCTVTTLPLTAMCYGYIPVRTSDPVWYALYDHQCTRVGVFYTAALLPPIV